MFFEQAFRHWSFKYRIENPVLLVATVQDLAERGMEFCVLTEHGEVMLYTSDSLELNIFPNAMPDEVVPCLLSEGDI